MKAIILAAGRGTRFGKITEKTPKSLIRVAGKPILERILFSLPPQIDEVVIVIGHLGGQIKKRFGDKFAGRDMKYVEMKELTGTGSAVWLVKPLLRDRFLVLNGDDIYSKNELGGLLKYERAAGLAKTMPQNPSYLTFQTDKKSYITGARYPNEYEMENGIMISTGAFVLDPSIFKYKLVPIAKGREFGLPQTILKSIRKFSLKGVYMKNWAQINRPEDIKKAEKILG